VVLLETDPGKARAAAREYMKFYLTLPAYQKNLAALGFNQTDLADGGSDPPSVCADPIFICGQPD